MENSEDKTSTAAPCTDLSEIIAAVKLAKADQIQRLLFLIIQE